ncbi:MAG TPA: hypothetical protein VG370_07010 [Chloroflexota bacterium]|nr:hypothetical protein [Chloroflexota bacterium]
MGLRSAFFVAAPTEVTAELCRHGPDGRHPSVSVEPLPDLALALLLAALEGREQGGAARRPDWGGFAVQGGPDGPWLARLPDALRDALAAASAEELRRLTTGLLGAAEPAPADAASRAALRAALVALARAARAEGEVLYLWIGL